MPAGTPSSRIRRSTVWWRKDAFPIVVGGTGLYLRAALTELDLRPPPEPDLRARLEQELAEVGPASLHGRLSTATAQAVHPNDRKRIVRALELELMGNAPHSGSDELWSEQLRRPTALFGLTMERDALIERIRGRAAAMLAGGAIEEVELALERGASRTARKALGFKEIAAHLQGDLSLDETRERIERGHIAYVKRQLTWMKKLAGVEVIDRTGLSAPQRPPRASSAASRTRPLDCRAHAVREMAGARQRLHHRRA